MFEDIEINYHFYDLYYFPTPSHLDCFEPCLLDLRCYGAVHVNNRCYIKNSQFMSSYSFKDCFSKNACRAYSLGKQ